MLVKTNNLAHITTTPACAVLREHYVLLSSEAREGAGIAAIGKHRTPIRFAVLCWNRSDDQSILCQRSDRPRSEAHQRMRSYPYLTIN